MSSVMLESTTPLCLPTTPTRIWKQMAKVTEQSSGCHVGQCQLSAAAGRVARCPCSQCRPCHASSIVMRLHGSARGVLQDGIHRGNR
jgi:hypothetical protein